MVIPKSHFPNCLVPSIDTSIGGFVYEDQFLQFATKMAPGSEMYGLGEHEHHSLRHEMNFQTWGMYSRDQPPAVSIHIERKRTI